MYDVIVNILFYKFKGYTWKFGIPMHQLFNLIDYNYYNVLHILGNSQHIFMFLHFITLIKLFYKNIILKPGTSTQQLGILFNDHIVGLNQCQTLHPWSRFLMKKENHSMATISKLSTLHSLNYGLQYHIRKVNQAELHLHSEIISLVLDYVFQLLYTYGGLLVQQLVWQCGN